MRGWQVGVAGLMLMLMTAGASAEEGATGSTESRVRAALEEINPALEAVDITESPIAGMMGVQLGNGQYIYVSEDGRHVLSGRLYELGENGVTDLTEARLQVARAQTLKELDLNKAITFKASTKAPRSEIFVFTDVTCAYCEKLQQSIADINAAGITVHYFAFPRAGVQSKAAAVMSRAWCSADPQAAISQAFLKQDITQHSVPCVSPVAAQYALGKKMGVTGTPGIYDASGRHLGGYLTVDQLRAALGLGEKGGKSKSTERKATAG